MVWGMLFWLIERTEEAVRARARPRKSAAPAPGPPPAKVPTPEAFRLGGRRHIVRVEHGPRFSLWLAPREGEQAGDPRLELRDLTYYRGRKLETLAAGDWVHVTGTWGGTPPALSNVRVRGPLVLETELPVGCRVEFTATFLDYDEETNMAWHIYLDACTGDGAELAPHAFIEFDWGPRLTPGDRIRLTGVVAFDDNLAYHLQDVQVAGPA